MSMENEQEVLELEGKFKTAAELGLSEDQRCGLIKALAYIEAGKITHINYEDTRNESDKTDSAHRFNMGIWYDHYPCGTVCCIGGTAEMLGSVGYPKTKIPFELRSLFGLVDDEFVFMHDITERQAGVALRGYLTTGKTDWATARKSPR